MLFLLEVLKPEICENQFLLSLEQQRITLKQNRRKKLELLAEGIMGNENILMITEKKN